MDDPTTPAVDQDTEQRARGLLFRNRDYTGWWIGATLSEFGTALAVVAYPLLVLAVTGSATGAGAVEAAVSIGYVVTLLVGGALADQFSRRTLMLLSPSIQAVAVITVTIAVFTDHVTIPHIVLVGFLQGLAGGLSGGAEYAALRRVVDQDQLPTAFSLMQARGMVIRLAGPAIGGVLYGLARFLPFLVDAISFVVNIVGVLMIRRPLGPDLDENEAREPVLKSIGGGIRFIMANAYLRFVLVWAALINACAAGLLILVIVLVHTRGGSPALVGAVNAIGAVGGLVGALVAARIVRALPGRLLVIVASWLMALAVAGIAVVTTAWAVGVLMAVLMFVVSPLNVLFSSYQARIIPDRLIGRASSAIEFGASSIRWVGALAAGLLASAISPAAATGIFAGLLALIAISTLVARGLRVLDTPLDQVVAD
ncbi:MFS transporter [Kribbella sp. NPDC051718]|uniref:MFS transporter n=1 Tax=Kribbella sp. NPDC051718 TaxID=3155168 RepID=UPI0034292DA6